MGYLERVFLFYWKLLYYVKNYKEYDWEKKKIYSCVKCGYVYSDEVCIYLGIL